MDGPSQTAIVIVMTALVDIKLILYKYTRNAKRTTVVIKFEYKYSKTLTLQGRQLDIHILK